MSLEAGRTTMFMAIKIRIIERNMKIIGTIETRASRKEKGISVEIRKSINRISQFKTKGLLAEKCNTPVLSKKVHINMAINRLVCNRRRLLGRTREWGSKELRDQGKSSTIINKMVTERWKYRTEVIWRATWTAASLLTTWTTCTWTQIPPDLWTLSKISKPTTTTRNSKQIPK